MQKKTVKRRIVLSLLSMLTLVVLFVLSTLWVGGTAQEQDIQRLQEDLRRASTHCYATEGRYPPNLPYLLNEYGVRYDESRFFVMYQLFSSNLPPDITVVEKQGEAAV